MISLRRLDVRLFLSYVVVVVVGAATLTIAFLLLAPTVFDDRMDDMTGRRSGMGSMTGSMTRANSHQAFIDALRVALPVAVLVSVGVAAFVAAFVARRILRPIAAVRIATARLGAGHYDERVLAPDEPELAALADDVNRLAAALEQTERRRSQLIGEVAHEMRTPLTTIDGYVEGILDGVFEPTDEVLTAITEESARLGRLASDLSALSRADEGALDLQLEVVDLGALSLRVADRLRAQFDGKGVALAATSDPDVTVNVDEQRTTQVITNLLGNALTYTPTGGSVRLHVSTLRGEAQVEVVDTGIGLAAEDVDQVFERFYRVPGVSRPPGGSGIGLTIARGLARAQRGDITARSGGLGQGTTVELRLPLHT